MPSADNRVVSLTFDNAQFEAAVAQTLGTLESLKKGLQFAGAGASLEAISSIDDDFNLNGMAGAIDDINSKFSVLGAVAFSVVQRIVNGGLDAAKSLAGIVFDPIIQGGKQRALNIDNAKFAFRTLGIDVEQAMESARLAVTGTAFGLDEAAKSAGLLGASGIGAGAEMTQALRGIAGAASVTQSSFGEIGDIYSSLAAKGNVSNADLERFAQRGLNATATLSNALGISQAEVQKLARDGEISFGQFSQIMDDTFGEQAQKANETYAGSLANMRASLSRLGAIFQGPLLTQQRDLFNALSPAIDKVAKALTPLFNLLTNISGAYFERLIAFINGIDFSSFEVGESVLKNINDALFGIYSPVSFIIEAIKNLFKLVWPILKAVGQAFADVFPNGSALDSLGVLLWNVSRLLDIMRPTPEVIAKVTSIFRGLFSVIAIGWEIFRNVVSLVKDFIASFSPITSGAGGGILAFFAGIGDALFRLKQALVDGQGIADFFDKIREAIFGFLDKIDINSKITSVVSALSDFFANLRLAFGGFGETADTAGAASDRVANRFSALGDAVNAVKEFFSKLGQALGNLIGGGFEKVGEIFGNIASAFGGFVSAVAEGIGSGDFSNLLDVLNTGIFAFLLVTIRKFLDGGLLNAIGGTGFKDVIVEVLEGVTGALKGLEQSLKAEALLKIAKALALLVLSLLILSLIDSADLTKALIALTATFGLLAGMLAAVNKIVDGFADGTKVAIISSALISLSIAVLLLAISVAIFALIPTDRLIQGLLGIGVVLGLLVLTVDSIDGDKVIKSAGSLLVLAIAVGLLALSVLILALLPFDKLVQGLLAVAFLIGVLVLTVDTIDGNKIIKSAGSLVVLAIAVGLLAISVLILGLIPFENMVQGLLAVGIALGLLVLAMNTMPSEGQMVAFAGSLLIISVALIAMAVAIGMLGSMDMGTLVQGLVAVIATLLILGVAAQFLSANILGALAIAAFATSLLILAVALTILGQLSLQQIGLGLLALIGVIVILAIASLIIGAAAPAIVGVATALLALGAAAFLAGAGVLMIALGFWLMADALGALINMIQGNQAGFLQALAILAKAIPVLILAIGNALIEVAAQFVAKLPELVKGLGVAIYILIEVLKTLVPQFGQLISLVIDVILKLIYEKVPLLVDAGYFMLMSFLKGMAENIGQVVDAVSTIIVIFLNTLAERIGEIVAAGLNLLVSFLQGIADNIGQVYTTAYSILAEIIRGITDGIGMIIKAGGDLIISLMLGIATEIYRVVNAGFDILTALMEGVAKRALEFAGDCFDLITDFLNALAEIVRQRSGELSDAGVNLIEAIMDGMIDGVGKLGGAVVDKFKELAGDIIQAMKDKLWIFSPSRVFREIGQNLLLGLIVGIEDDAKVTGAVVSFADGVVDTMKDSLAGAYDAISTMEEFNPTISPVLDLSNIENESGRISGILGNSTLGSSISFGQASAIAQSTAEQSSSDASGTSPTVQEIKFEQIINAPKELSAGDIYRNTKSQLAMAKEGLKKL